MPKIHPKWILVRRILPVEAACLSAPGRRYSPGEFIGVRVELCAGAPNIDKIGTSHVERVNLTVRTFNRRFVRLDWATQRNLRTTGIRSRCSWPHTTFARSIRQREHRQSQARD
ncbi:MAG TPA: hypothetical protein VGF13_17830 [Verrucomicrobiae bacterium]|jgi:hypothetical protein